VLTTQGVRAKGSDLEELGVLGIAESHFEAARCRHLRDLGVEVHTEHAHAFLLQLLRQPPTVTAQADDDGVGNRQLSAGSPPASRCGCRRSKIRNHGASRSYSGCAYRIM
jgi:hypothetical protein